MWTNNVTKYYQLFSVYPLQKKKRKILIEDNVDTSHIVFRSVARRKTDLMPTIPSPRDGHYGSRSSLSNTPSRTPGKTHHVITTPPPLLYHYHYHPPTTNHHTSSKQKFPPPVHNKYFLPFVVHLSSELFFSLSLLIYLVYTFLLLPCFSLFILLFIIILMI